MLDKIIKCYKGYNYIFINETRLVLIRLVLLRHATAFKNIEDRHGGLGTGLIPKAEKEVLKVVKKLKKNGIEYKKIFCSPVPQARETSKIISNICSVDIYEDLRLKPLDLGILAGLSRDEAIQKYPESAKLMEKWRQGKIEIHELIIPKAESYKSFYQRGQSFLDSLDDLNQDILIIGTRSILILLISIMTNRTIEPGGGYKGIPMDNCTFFVFKKDCSNYMFESKYSNCTKNVKKELSCNGKTN